MANRSRAIIAEGDEPFFLCWWNYSVHYPFEAPAHLIDKYKRRVGPGIKKFGRFVGLLVEFLNLVVIGANVFLTLLHLCFTHFGQT